MGSITRQEFDSLCSPQEQEINRLSSARGVIQRAMACIDHSMSLQAVTVRLDKTVPEVSDTIFGYERVYISLGNKGECNAEAFRRNLAAIAKVPVIRSQKNKSELIFCGTLDQLTRIDPCMLAARIRNDHTNRDLNTYRGVTR